jgi:hypothetical protein
MSVIRHLVAASLAASTTTACAPVEPSLVQMNVKLTGTQEVPPTPSAGTGQGTITFDRATRQLGWSIAYAGLTGPLQSAHLHGPAMSGANAGVAVAIPVTFSPLAGVAIITEPMAADLLAGRFYVNLHTPSFPNGEIRGQVVGATPM